MSLTVIPPPLELGKTIKFKCHPWGDWLLLQSEVKSAEIATNQGRSD